MKTIGLKSVIILSCAYLLVGCAADQPALEEPEPRHLPSPDESGPETAVEVNPLLEIRRKEAYVIGPGDVLEISVWRHEDADAEATVDFAGDVTFPIIGACKAEGFTLRELNRNVSGRLSKYYKDPQVRLLVAKYKNRRVYVLGEFTTPGVQILEGNDTLLDLIANAGGVTQGADLSRLTIVRGRGMMIRIDLNQLLSGGNLDLNINIQPNDLIYLPDDQENQVYVFGEIDQPGIYSLHPNYTAVEAVMAAGGPTEDAALSRARVFRGNRENPEEIPVDLHDILKKGDKKTNILLRPQDIVYVPSRFISDVNYYLRQVLPALQTIVLTDQAGQALSLD